MVAIAMRGVSKRYDRTVAVRNLDLTIENGETFVLIGPSGCGKTTSLRMINRLVESSGGTIEVMGTDIREHDPPELRRRIGYVIQEVGLFDHWTVARNIGVVPRLLGWARDRIDARVVELLELLGLAPTELANRFPRQLSGGQRQRVGIARALAADPEIVLLDEPFGALDPITREGVQDEFLALSSQFAKTFVLVTHDVFEAFRLGDRIGVMHEGELVRCATPRELVTDPGSELVASMLGRHRFQLRLMSVSLAELLPSAGHESPASDAGAIHMAATASVWDAVARSESEGAPWVAVDDGGETRWLARERLLEAGR